MLPFDIYSPNVCACGCNLWPCKDVSFCLGGRNESLGRVAEVTIDGKRSCYWLLMVFIVCCVTLLRPLVAPSIVEEMGCIESALMNSIFSSILLICSAIWFSRCSFVLLEPLNCSRVRSIFLGCCCRRSWPLTW